ncbi:DUF3592 domain-containing protein [Corynebacterium heidelbergense]|uniref:DUF3592 domain-containing protein n=1 Tax=Corynebacterium heidelbergense TaxID=2055947 RepID=UPI000DD7AF49|nr:DUF3592 domain-containing protein [Corynebacterium heidelbergense]WCZ37368.1 hypothetical protein CHEID_09210 [Corynebacterium heidelbergense]
MDANNPGVARPVSETYVLPLRFRRAAQAIVAFGIFAILVCSGLVISSGIDDARIARDRARAVATVVSADGTRTTVRFRDANGNYYQPDTGLKYPVGLQTGQRVRVEYQASDPKNVKVEGRSWLLAFRPALSSLALALVIAAVLAAVLRWRKKRWVENHGSPPAGT